MISAIPNGMARALDRIDRIIVRMRDLEPTWRPADIGRLPIGDPGIDPAGAAPSALARTPQDFATALSAASTGTVRRPKPASPAPAQGAPAQARLVTPVAGGRVTQPFGPSELSLEPAGTVGGRRYPHVHDGLDLAAPLGRPVVAAADGRVLFAGRTDDGAVVVRIAHDDGSETQYGHLAVDLTVQAGDRVSAGQRIGRIGLTGNTTGPHLHFELWRGGRAVDPAPWLGTGHQPGNAAPMTGLAAGSGMLPDRAALAAFDRVADRIPFATEIRRAAGEAGLDPQLLASLVRAESNFRPGAVSRAGAMGLTQLMPATARGLDVDEPFDPAENLRGGARYLAGNLRIYGRVDLALAAYQAGKGAVRAAGGIPDSPTTRGYIDTVLGAWASYLGSAR